MIGRSAGNIGLHLETQTREIQIINKNIDDTNRAVFSDIIVKPFRKQGGLVAILAFNKSTHRLLLIEKS